jgi:integrase
MIDSGICRNEINKRVRRIVRAFKWAVGEEMVPSSAYQGLKAVPGLRRGRADVRESKPVRPVPEPFVDAVRPFVARQVWAMIELQRLTGMRPGEVTSMRSCDIDASGRVWTYSPSEHKTEHHGKERTIYLGPQAQAIVKPWLRTELTAYLFSPSEAMEERKARMRRSRKTPVQPSQRCRAKPKPEKTPGERYDTDSYRRAIAYGCKRAFPHPTLKGIPNEKLTAEHRQELKAWHKAHCWHPHQLRHNAGTRLRKEFGLDVARVILGHSSPVVTEVYAEMDREKAIAVMERVG